VFKKFLSKIGVGNTKVNLLLPKEEFVQGETFQAKIIIEPGSVEQQVDHIDVVLRSTHAYEGYNLATGTGFGQLLHVQINEKFVIAPGSPVKEIPLEITISRNTPISTKAARHYFDTSLDVDDALDPTDKDKVTIIPCPEMTAVMSAIERLGFIHEDVYSGGTVVNGRQEFEFKASGMLHGKINELEVAFEISLDSVDLYMEFEKRVAGTKYEIEKRAVLRISNKEIALGNDHIMEILSKFIQAECANL
jgi:sporulation-control protein